LGHPLFQPQVHHLYSGRDNDQSMTAPQAMYFARTVAGIILGW